MFKEKIENFKRLKHALGSHAGLAVSPILYRSPEAMVGSDIYFC